MSSGVRFVRGLLYDSSNVAVTTSAVATNSQQPSSVNHCLARAAACLPACPPIFCLSAYFLRVCLPALGRRYPVANIDTMEALGGGGRLALCVMMKWGSTVEDLWKYLTRQETLPQMRGDFVRATARGFDPGAAPYTLDAGVVGPASNAKKADTLSPRNCIIQIMVRTIVLHRLRVPYGACRRR